VDKDGTIYVGSFDHELYAVNSGGTLKWSYTAGAALGSSPAIGSDGTVYVGGNDGKLYAVNAVYQPVWRFRTIKEGYYLWTADPAERKVIDTTLKSTWIDEGVAYQINTANPLNSSPLWRFRNRHHPFYFYTSSVTEKNNLINKLSKDWLYEGPAYNVSNDPSGAPVWRFLNLANGRHFYTSDANEKNTIVNTLSDLWKLEGPAYYIAP
jgi:outer membrane protein assembly factor BamB